MKNKSLKNGKKRNLMKSKKGVNNEVFKRKRI